MRPNASSANPNVARSRVADMADSAVRPQNRHAGLGVPMLLAFLAIALDRGTKAAAERYLEFHAPVPVLGDSVRLVLWFNEGAAFGLKFGRQWVHIALSLFAMVLVVYMIFHTPREDRLSLWGFGLIIGGAIGNLWDRLASGQVTDFIDVGIGMVRWPTFNLADSSVVMGIGFLIIAHVRWSRLRKGDSPEGTADADAIRDGEAPRRTSRGA